jgi:ABC-2 type transport system permease protein
MIVRIVRHEWRLLAADRTAAVVSVAFGLLLLGAAASGASWARAQRTALDEVVERQDARYVESRAEVAKASTAGAAAPEWGPGNAGYLGSFVGRYAVQPPAPLAALAIGQSDLYAPYSRVTARLREAVAAGDQTANPLLLMTGQFDLAFALIYLYPLFVLAIAYDLTSGEREDGTLRLVASQPIRLRQLVTGKVLARGTVVLLPALLAPLAALAFAGGSVGPGAGLRLLLWSFAVAAYGLLWFGLAVLVNAAGRRPAFNALALASTWLALVVVAPAAINVAVTSAYPIPSRVEFINAARAATDRARVEGSRVLGRFIEEHPEFSVAGDAMKNASLLQAARDDEIERDVAPVVARFEAQLARQHGAVAWLRYLSPAALLQGVLVDAAGTGFDRYRHFFQQADAFHEQWREHFQPLLFANRALTPADYDQLPAFAYREEAIADVAGRTVGPLLVLVALAASLLAFGLARFSAYPVAES